MPATAEVARVYADANKWKAVQREGRDCRFKRSVLAGYRYTCARTGDRLRSARGQPLHVHADATVRPPVEFLRWHARRCWFGAVGVGQRPWYARWTRFAVATGIRVWPP